MNPPGSHLAGHIGPPADEAGEPDLLATGEYVDAVAAKLARQWPAMGQGMIALLLDCFDSGYRPAAQHTSRR